MNKDLQNQNNKNSFWSTLKEIGNSPVVKNQILPKVAELGVNAGYRIDFSYSDVYWEII